MTYNPRNRNERTHDEPRATSRWFDYRRNEKPKHPFGFHKEPTA